MAQWTVKELCDARGIKYAWLARQIGLSRQNLDHVLAGRRRTPKWFYERVAHALGVPEDWLRPKTDEPEPAEVA